MALGPNPASGALPSAAGASAGTDLAAGALWVHAGAWRTWCGRAGRAGAGPPIVVLADDGTAGTTAAALASSFLVVRPLSPDGIERDVAEFGRWLTGVLDGLGLTSVGAVVAAEPFGDAALAHARGDDGRVARVLLVGRRRAAALALHAWPEDDLTRRLVGALTAAGLRPEPGGPSRAP